MADANDSAPRAKYQGPTDSTAPGSRWAKPRCTLTADQMAQICHEIGLSNNVAAAAALAGVSTQVVRNALKADPEFAERYATAQADYAQAVLLTAAQTRAVQGVEEPLFYRGEPARDENGKPAKKRHYSDTLLLRLLERYDPTFRPHQVVETKPEVSAESLDELSPEAKKHLEAFLEQRAKDQAATTPTTPATGTPEFD